MARAVAAAASKVLHRRDGGVLRVLRAEIDHELSSSSSSSHVPSPAAGHFSVEWDDGKARDVVLRARTAGEEVVVSALLGPLIMDGEERVLPGNVFMKVCLMGRRGGGVLQFDCEAWERQGGAGRSDFHVRRISCFPSPDSHWSSLPKSPRGKLQGAFKEYLINRGINVELTDYLIQHLREKEKKQYLNWLHTVEAAFR